MKSRLIVGTILIVLGIVFFVLRAFVSAYVLDALILIISIGGSLEICNMLKKANKPANAVLTIIYCVLSYGAVLLTIIFQENIYKSLLLIPILLISIFIIAIVYRLLSNHDNNDSIKYAVNVLLSCIYPALLYVPIYYLNHISAFGVIDGANSLLELFLVLVVFIVPIFTDTMAFCIGKTLKGKKLAPKISPNKTISGAIGGLIGGLISGIGLYLIFNYLLGLEGLFVILNINIYSVTIVSIILSAFSQAGDLFSSYLKRRHNIKDYSNLFQEHGGFMDRFDGETFVSPIFFMVVILMILLV